jgi:hypothetical protein
MMKAFARVYKLPSIEDKSRTPSSNRGDRPIVERDAFHWSQKERQPTVTHRVGVGTQGQRCH